MVSNPCENNVAGRENQEVEIPDDVRHLCSYLLQKGIRDKQVILSVAWTPRELFLPEKYRKLAYLDAPIPNEYGQMISEFSLVAAMTEFLKLSGKEKVLEIGTGSGYQTTILSILAKEVITVEEIPELSQLAQERLKRLNLDNVRFFSGDASGGWPQEAPYDRILLTCGIVAEDKEETPPSLVHMREQLTPDGFIVTPLGSLDEMSIFIIPKEGKVMQTPYLVRFQPLRGKYGFKEG